MTEKYVDTLRLRLSGFEGLPFPEEVEEVWEISVWVGGKVDRDSLVADLQEGLRQQDAYILQDTYNLHEWGASGAAILLDVSTVVGGAAGLVYLFERLHDVIRKRATKSESASEAISTEQAADSSRLWLADCLRVRVVSIQVVEVQPTENGIRVMLETPVGRFHVTQGADGTKSLKRIRSA